MGVRSVVDQGLVTSDVVPGWLVAMGDEVEDNIGEAWTIEGLRLSAGESISVSCITIFYDKIFIITLL